MVKVSVIIPTYNRFKYLLNAIESVVNQTHKDIEVIVVNDCSTEEEYYSFDFNSKFGEKLRIIHLDKNTKKMFGKGAPGYVRIFGIKVSNGEYIAFLDDDDIWFATKLEKQLSAMNQNNCEMSSTEGLIGNKRERYNKDKKYKRYLGQNFFNHLQKIYKNHNIDLKNGFPKIWDQNFIKIHNCMITSSVIIKKEILEKVNYMDNRPYGEDWFCWKKCLEYTKSVYLDDDVYFYYA